MVAVGAAYDSLVAADLDDDGDLDLVTVGGDVLDPFFGAGTTGVVALKQGKQFIGIELNPEYIKIAQRRLRPYLQQQRLIA